MTANEFEWFYEQMHQRFQGFVRERGYSEVAEDLTQDAFLILWQKREEIACDNHATGWMIKTLKYLMANYLKKKRYRNQFLSHEEAEQYGQIDWAYGFLECEMLLEEYMSDRDCKAFLEYYGFGVPIRKIAEREGAREEVVRMRLHRLKNKMKYDVINHNIEDIYR